MTQYLLLAVLLLPSLLYILSSLAHYVAPILFSQSNIIVACNCASSRTGFVLLISVMAFTSV